MLTPYANQSIIHEVASAPNAYNEIQYAAAVSIKGRKEGSNRLIRTATGEEVVAGAFVMTGTLVTVNDKLDGRVVLRVDPVPALSGVTAFYEVYLS